MYRVLVSCGSVAFQIVNCQSWKSLEGSDNLYRCINPRRTQSVWLALRGIKPGNHSSETRSSFISSWNAKQRFERNSFHWITYKKCRFWNYGRPYSQSEDQRCRNIFACACLLMLNDWRRTALPGVWWALHAQKLEFLVICSWIWYMTEVLFMLSLSQILPS